MLKSFVHFASICLATKGSHSIENQNALNAALASWVDDAIENQNTLDVTLASWVDEVGRILGQSWKALRRV
jgi:hypothetical protein